MDRLALTRAASAYSIPWNQNKTGGKCRNSSDQHSCWSQTILVSGLRVRQSHELITKRNYCRCIFRAILPPVLPVRTAKGFGQLSKVPVSTDDPSSGDQRSEEHTSELQSLR